MLNIHVKKELVEVIQTLLQNVNDSELPDGEISFILHVDGAEGWSWANIRNAADKNVEVPDCLVTNLTVVD